MAAVLNFHRPSFDATDLATLQSALSQFHYPGDWAGWSQEFGRSGECEAIDVVDPNDWDPLTLRRTFDGRYQANDSDGHVVAMAATFDELLRRLEFVTH